MRTGPLLTFSGPFGRRPLDHLNRPPVFFEIATPSSYNLNKTFGTAPSPMRDELRMMRATSALVHRMPDRWSAHDNLYVAVLAVVDAVLLLLDLRAFPRGGCNGAAETSDIINDVLGCRGSVRGRSSTPLCATAASPTALPSC